MDKKGRKSKNVEDRRPGSLHLRMKVYGNESPEQEKVRKEVSDKMDERLGRGAGKIRGELKRQTKNRAY